MHFSPEQQSLSDEQSSSSFLQDGVVVVVVEVVEVLEVVDVVEVVSPVKETLSSGVLEV